MNRLRQADILSDGLIPGVLGGLVGGLVFGAATIELGGLESIASLVRLESSVAGFVVHMVVAAVVGSGLGLIVWHQRPGICDTLFWGIVYGTFWWFLGPLTLRPAISDYGLAWNPEAAQTAFPALIGHVLYGASAGATIVLVRLKDPRLRSALHVSPGTLLRGGIAGLLAVWIIGSVMAAQGQLPAFTGGVGVDSRLSLWLVTLAIGLLAGVGFAIVYPDSRDGAGAAIVRGTVYGFLLWMAIPLTLLPVINGSGLPWALSAVREVFSGLPAYVLMGAALALFYHWLSASVRVLFSDLVMGGDQEGVGTQGIRAVTRGLLSGLIGGLIFTGVMTQLGAFSGVASLIGVSSPIAGFFVHMAIANIVGATYGLLFSRQSYDVGSALGWGASYGFIWWLIGTLTLSPILLGDTPQWSADFAAQGFPFLIGHLIYGSGLGITFYLLEARYKPWWVPRRQAEAELINRRREQVLTSAPALWTLVVVISLTLPVLLGSEGLTTDFPSSIY